MDINKYESIIAMLKNNIPCLINLEISNQATEVKKYYCFRNPRVIITENRIVI